MSSLFIFFILNILLVNNENIQCSSNITIKINMIGCHKIYADDITYSYSHFTKPDEIYINNIIQINSDNKYYCNETKNIIKLVWYNQTNIYSYLFRGCHNISEVDFSNFDSSNIIAMHAMFYDCYSLTSINFGNLNTSKLITFRYIFYNCISLKSLNLSNFDISQVTMMEFLFYNCTSLSNVYLPYINMENSVYMKYMFLNCSKLEYLNMINMVEDPSKTFQTSEMFNGIPNNIIVCINQTQSPILYDLLVQTTICPTFICTNEDWRFIRKKINGDNCVDNCKDINKYDYEGICYNECPNGTKIWYYSDNFCLDKCGIDNYKYEYNGICYEKCPNGTNDKENEFICIDNEFKESTSEFSNSYTFPEINTMKTNFPEISNKIDIIDLSFPIISFTSYKSEITTEIYNTSNIYKNEEKYISENYKNDEISDFKNIGIDNKFNISDLKDIYNNTEIYEIIKEKILIGYSPYSTEAKIIEGTNNIIFQITSEKNELELLNKYNSSKYYDYSILDLGDCKTKLKENYHINENDSLIIIKREKINCKASDKNIEYEVYEPYNKTKLNLTLCSETKINLYVKMDMSREIKNIYEKAKELGYNIFDINDPFYNDICTPYKTSNNTDILLSDRIDYIYNNDDSQCQKNCEFSGYLLNSQFINCTCEFNEKSKDEKKIDKFSTKKIYESFIDVIKYSNYEIFECYKLVFSLEFLSKNKGSIIIIVYFIPYLICAIVYIIKGLKPLKIKLQNNIGNEENNIIKKGDNVDMKKSNFKEGKNESKLNPSKKKSEKSINSKKKSVKEKKNQKKDLNKKKIIMEFKNEKKASIDKKVNNNLFIFQRFQNNDKTKKSKFVSDKNLLESFASSRKENKSDILFQEQNIQKIRKFDDFELNEFEYEEAVKYDQRTFIQIYFSLLKREHKIIFTFFIYNDYNLFYIKICRFMLLISSDMAMNALFFSHDSMHKMFLNYGKYDIFQQIPQIIYSTIISQLIEVFLCFLSLTDKHIYQIKNLSSLNLNNKISTGIFRRIKIKLVFFFLFTAILFLFFWYMVTSFCSVYQSTQSAFIKDSLISFLLSLLFPFVIYLLPSALRVCALRDKKVGLRCIYKLSEIIPFF